MKSLGGRRLGWSTRGGCVYHGSSDVMHSRESSPASRSAYLSIYRTWSDIGPQHLVGWGGRIRTFNLLIQSQLRYRCATPQARYRDRPPILASPGIGPDRAFIPRVLHKLSTVVVAYRPYVAYRRPVGRLPATHDAGGCGWSRWPSARACSSGSRAAEAPP
jgi:hypothetical protein